MNTMKKWMIFGTVTALCMAANSPAQSQTRSLSFSALAVADLIENGPPRNGVVLRSGPLDEDVVVNLSSGDRTEATVPVTVVIPAGFDARIFPITPVDDALVDGPQFAPIMAVAPGYGSATMRAQVKDDEVSLTVSVQDSVIDENAGVAATVGRVTLSAPVPIRVGIRVYSTLPGLLVNGVVTGYRQFAYVDLLPGQSSGAFRIDAIDNAQIQGNQSGSISADVSFPFGGDYSRSQFIQGNFVPVTIRDDESSVRLQVRPRTLVEGQTSSAQVFLGVQSNRTQPNTVTLESSRPEIVRVPAAVSVTPGRSGATFSIEVVANSVESTQEVTITARRNGYQAASIALQVLDAGAPRLKLRIAPRLIDEAFSERTTSGAGGTVSIEAPRDTPLEVRLSSADAGEVRVPGRVVIPAGSVSARFTIEAVDDRLYDGTKTVAIFAEADDFVSAQSVISVRDANPFVTASITPSALSESAGENAARLVLKLSRASLEGLFIPVQTQGGRLRVTSTIFIPPGSTLVSVPVGVINNQRVNATGNDFLEVRQPFASTAFRGTPPIILPVQIFEDDGALSLFVSNPRLSERGPRTARATVTRRGVLLEPLVVTLRTFTNSSDATIPLLLRAPRSLVIAAGARSASFDISVADDDKAYLLGRDFINVLAAGATIEGRAEDAVLPITIEDDDSTSLSLRFDADVVGESGLSRAIATLELSSPARNSYTFLLRNSNAARLEVPKAIVIAQGQRSVTFFVDAINDNGDDGDATATITAQKSGFTTTTNTVTVLDDDDAP